MQLSVSLPDEDVAILDQYARAAGLPSRSVAVQHPVHLLRLTGLEQHYEAAWAEWDASGQEAAWSATVGDGIVDAAR